MRGCGRTGRRSARRITASGRAGAGPRSPPRSRRCACGLAALGFRRGDKLGDHRRQPAAALLGDRRDAGPGRRAGADLPGLDRRRDGLRARPRRGAFRRRRGPGAGRQAGSRSRSAARCSKGDHLLRPARHAPLRPALRSTAYAKVQERGRDFAAPAAGVFPRRDRQGAGQRHRDHPLHLGHDRPAQGRRAHLRQHHHHRAERRSRSRA